MNIKLDLCWESFPPVGKVVNFFGPERIGCEIVELGKEILMRRRGDTIFLPSKR